MLALQPDIVSLEYCDELFNLLDRIPPFPYAHVEQVFVEEFGATPDALFERFEHQPIATASIGQVHVAYLAGRKYAVKVQRPNVDTEFAGDIRLMVIAMRAIRRFGLTSLNWTLEPMGEFVAWTREELDYRREARYADRLRQNAADNPFECVPAIEWSLTSRRTLVVEYLSGPTVIDYLRACTGGDEVLIHRLRSGGFDPNRFARHIIDNFLGDAFRFGVFHADLHPANLLILPGDVVGYVDFGITGVLSRYSRRHLIAMTLAYTRADVEGMAQEFSKLTSQEPDADPEAFRTKLLELSQEWYEGEGSETAFKKNFTLVMLDMLTLSRKTGIWPERDVIKYIRSAIAVDGLITRFAPGFNVGRHLETVCEQWVAWEARRSLVSRDACRLGDVHGASGGQWRGARGHHPAARRRRRNAGAHRGGRRRGRRPAPPAPRAAAGGHYGGADEPACGGRPARFWGECVYRRGDSCSVGSRDACELDEEAARDRITS